jgi:NADPH:quinone reductase-like Zn-dependent oxidoreductase
MRRSFPAGHPELIGWTVPLEESRPAVLRARRGTRRRVTLGVNPGDRKKRAGWRGSPMSYPRVIPHSDAAGVIDAVVAGVDDARIGKRVWVFGAQSYRPFGTAASHEQPSN